MGANEREDSGVMSVMCCDCGTYGRLMAVLWSATSALNQPMACTAPGRLGRNKCNQLGSEPITWSHFLRTISSSHEKQMAALGDDILDSIVDGYHEQSHQ